MAQIILKSPTVRTIQFCDIKKGCLLPLNGGSLFSNYDLDKIALAHNIWDEKDLLRKKEIEQTLKDMVPSCEKQNIENYDSIANICYQLIVSGIAYIDIEKPFICDNIYKKNIQNIDLELIKELNEIKAKLLYLYNFSSDALLERFYNYFILRRSVLDYNLQPIYKTDEDFLNIHPSVANLLLARFIEFRNYIPEHIIRYIARGEGEAGYKWYILWYSSKISGYKLFDELDEFKMALIRWTEKYDNIRNSYEPPNDDIINDDNALDCWLFEKKIEKENKISENIFRNNKQELSFIDKNAMTFEGGE
jgi:hypothetical protein